MPRMPSEWAVRLKCKGFWLLLSAYQWLSWTYLKGEFLVPSWVFNNFCLMNLLWAGPLRLKEFWALFPHRCHSSSRPPPQWRGICSAFTAVCGLNPQGTEKEGHFERSSTTTHTPDSNRTETHKEMRSVLCLHKGSHRYYLSQHYGNVFPLFFVS